MKLLTLALLAIPSILAAQSDTTILQQVRIRRAATGRVTITSTIVTSKIIHDTVRITIHDSIGYPVEHYAKYFYWKPVFKADTLRLFLDTSSSSGAYPVGFPAYGLTCQNPTTIPQP